MREIFDPFPKYWKRWNGNSVRVSNPWKHFFQPLEKLILSILPCQAEAFGEGWLSRQKIAVSLLLAKPKALSEYLRFNLGTRPFFASFRGLNLRS
jgi:hypothetical protein